MLDRGEDNYKWLMLATVAIYLTAASVTGWLLGPLERVGSLNEVPS